MIPLASRVIEFLKMEQHGGTGHRPALATCLGLLLPFTLIFFIQIFEPRNSPQTILVFSFIFHFTHPSYWNNQLFPDNPNANSGHTPHSGT